jgi:PAS domain S-box-containing protein
VIGKRTEHMALEILPKCFETDIERSLKEKPGALVTLFTVEGTLLYISPSTTEILGYDQEEGLGHNVREYFYPLDVSHIEIAMQDAMLFGKSVAHSRFVKMKSGERRHMQGVTTKLVDPETQKTYLMSVSLPVD